MFLNQALIVGEQTCVLFVLIAVGFVCRKTGLLNEKGNQCINNIVIYLVTPCVIIKSFQREFNAELLQDFLLVCAFALAMHLIMILASRLIFHNPDKQKRALMRFASVFSNCGFMALPLVQVLLGDMGVFYVSAYIVVFNVVIWTWGVSVINPGSKFSPKKILLNQGIIGVVIGMIIFVCRIKLPAIISEPISYMASLNTPLPMILVGYYLAGADLRHGLFSRETVLCICMRLLIFPMIFLFLLKMTGISQEMLLSCLVCAAAPVGTMTTVMCTRFNGDVEMSVKLVSLSTLLSVLTMPVIIALAQTIL